MLLGREKEQIIGDDMGIQTVYYGYSVESRYSSDGITKRENKK